MAPLEPAAALAAKQINQREEIWQPQRGRRGRDAPGGDRNRQSTKKNAKINEWKPPASSYLLLVFNENRCSFFWLADQELPKLHRSLKKIKMFARLASRLDWHLLPLKKKEKEVHIWCAACELLGGDFPRCICNILKHHYIFFIAYFNDLDFFHPFYLTKKIALTSYFDHN